MEAAKFPQDDLVQAASLPTLAKNARMGHPQREWRMQRSQKMGHPPAIIYALGVAFGEIN
jgi:hypothetical protein